MTGGESEAGDGDAPAIQVIVLVSCIFLLLVPPRASLSACRATSCLLSIHAQSLGYLGPCYAAASPFPRRISISA